MKRRIVFPPAGFVGFDVRLPRLAASSSSGWRRRAEIEVELLLQSSDDVRHVGELILIRSDFRFDAIHSHVQLFGPLYGRIVTD
jgi:hypothetical protein